MKKPNTLPELFRHAADLMDKSESLADKFECLYAGWKTWRLSSSTFPNFNDGNKWRIADQDQHLLDDGWIRHTGDVCPVHPKDEIFVLLENQHLKVGNREPLIPAHKLIWDRDVGVTRITHYKVTKAYVEPTTFEMKVGDKVFVLNKPYMNLPCAGSIYFYIDTYGNIGKASWFTLKVDGYLLKTFNCWRTEDDAKAYAKAKLARDKFEIGDIKC
jgi:hypothetical protein